MMRVLYAEDDPQVADVVRMCFRHYATDAELAVVASGHECLAAMQTGGYDVLLLDLQLPDLNGLQVLGELAARGDVTPVVMVSGHGQHELAVRALRAGAVDCIDKASPDFRRIPDIVSRVHARHPRRPVNGITPASHRVLFIDPNAAERDAVMLFLASSGAGLKLVAGAPDALEPLLQGQREFDAVILGPMLPPDAMLAALRKLRALDDALPVIVISAVNHAETTIAAFKLGAHDYLLRGPDCFAELGFSLNNALRQADIQKLNARLSNELAELNRSLAEQVAARTRDLESEIVVRREAEQRSEENAARLQALSNRLIRVQEDERHALAQELHDQIGQLLTGLRFQLESARQAAPTPSVDNALTITDDLLRSVRAMTLQLRPRLLDDLGLRPALEWHAKVFGNQTGIAVELELSLPEKRFSPELEIAVFRMVQEALTNVARHSGAAAATVTVTADDHSLHVEVSDRGCGFDTAKAFAKHDSLGLTGLAERVRIAGGRFELFSRAGQGTRLHAEFSLQPAHVSP
ncbi:MAG TPA: response regulator [Opitutaceae bacterium]|nr:response regulator [Opitutaceae bacterium]